MSDPLLSDPEDNPGPAGPINASPSPGAPALIDTGLGRPIDASPSPGAPELVNPGLGRLIGVSLGPGDPELVTRRAWAILQSGARWAYPVKAPGAPSYALEIVRRGGLPIPEDAEALVFPMTRDPEVLAAAWTSAAARALDLLGGGRDLAVLVEGDASTFATFGHLARAVRALAPGLRVETVPGVSSFAAAAAASGLPLAEEGDILTLIPSVYDLAAIERLLDAGHPLVLMKAAPVLNELLDALERRGRLADACFVERVGAPEERIVRDLASLRGTAAHYLSLLLVPARKTAAAAAPP